MGYSLSCLLVSNAGNLLTQTVTSRLGPRSRSLVQPSVSRAVRASGGRQAGSRAGMDGHPTRAWGRMPPMVARRDAGAAHRAGPRKVH
jgi:hypothetical protein